MLKTIIALLIIAAAGAHATHNHASSFNPQTKTLNHNAAQQMSQLDQ